MQIYKSAVDRCGHLLLRLRDLFRRSVGRLPQVYNPTMAAPAKIQQQQTCTWSDLPIDLVVAILKRLSTVDHIRFGAVCTTWHSLWKQKLCQPAQPRVLMLSSPRDARSFFDLTTGKTYRMNCPYELERGRYWFGTSVDGGWVVHVADNGELGLLHLATGQNIPLRPPSTVCELRNFTDWASSPLFDVQRDCIYDGDFRTHPELIPFFFRKAVVIGSVDGSPGCGRTPPLVVLIYGGSVYYCRPGDGSWCRLVWETYILDVVLHKGRLCAVDFDGTAIAWDPSSSSFMRVAWPERLGPEILLGPEMSDCEICQKCLVSDGGELWQVWRELGIFNMTCKTLAVRAFKLDPAGDRWSEVKSLDGRVFFLGNNYPVVRSADDTGRRNCIYFTDDDSMYLLYPRSNDCPCGVYHLEDGSWEQLPLPARAFAGGYPNPIWVTPYLPQQ